MTTAPRSAIRALGWRVAVVGVAVGAALAARAGHDGAARGALAVVAIDAAPAPPADRIDVAVARRSPAVVGVAACAVAAPAALADRIAVRIVIAPAPTRPPPAIPLGYAPKTSPPAA